MRIPDSLVPLVDHGVVDEVVRSLKSGKEADVYLVASEGFYRVAKVYKDAQSRSFKNRSAYTEGRQVRSSRDQRAMDKGSKYGKAQNEAAWQSAEVDMIYRLDSAGVRVPKPHHFIDGVLIMELVASADGQPAPRLGEMEFTAEEAQVIFTKLLADVVKMLVAGVVHGDLSEFNVLVSAEGPVVIDFPQSVNAARNQNARKMLMRDVENLQNFLKRWVPGTPTLRYAEEMWQLYEKSELTDSTQLTGKFIDERKLANTVAVLGLIEDARRDERFKRQHTGKNLRGLGGGAPGEPASAQPKPPHAQQTSRPAHAPNPPRPHQGAGHAQPAHAPNPPRPHQGAGHARPAHAPNHPRPKHGADHPRSTHAQPQARQPHGEASRPNHGDSARAHPPNPPRSPHPQHPRAPHAQASGNAPPHHGRPHGNPPNPPRPAHPHGHQRPPHAQSGAPRPQGAHPPRGGPRRPNPIVETKPQLGGAPAPRPSGNEGPQAHPMPPLRK